MDDDAAVEAALRDALAAARQKYPGVAFAPELFEARTREIVPLDAADRAASIAALEAADLYLAIACEAGDARALSVFDSVVLARVPSFVAAVARDEDLADEARQRVRERLLVAEPGERPRIAAYAGRGPLEAWVRVTAVRIALDLRRAEQPRPRETDAIVLDEELSMIKDAYRDAFQRALRDALGELDANERSWLRLHFLEGWNLDRLAVVFGVSRATAGRRVLSLRERLGARTRELLGQRLKATPEEIASLVGLLQSRIEWSLRSALGD